MKVEDLMNKGPDPELLTVRSLLTADTYVIPLYQRAYAWSHTEIEQLFSDIRERFEAESTSRYYIGSMVVFKRDGDRYELVDGQQRHTTLTLAAAVIQRLFSDLPLEGVMPSRSNLCYLARPAAGEWLEQLFNLADGRPAPGEIDPTLQSLMAAVADIRNYFEGLHKDYNPERLADYIRYFYDGVSVIRIGLPKDTDLNRYFEIMNNRGEQLEPHEILKARFLGTLTGKSEVFRQQFAQVWDACAQVGRYVQSGFKQGREKVFGADWQNIPVDYLAHFEPDDTVVEREKVTLTELLAFPVKTGAIDSDEPTERFRSVINFPNFLLQVLRLYSGDESVSLDDKNLLAEFGCTNRSRRSLPDAVLFVNKLFYYRVCFDRYVIKREDGGPAPGWKIQFLDRDNNYKAVFEDAKALVMIQSMLHVSFPANNYKNWLQSVLALFKDHAIWAKEPFYEQLQLISRNIFLKTNKNLLGGTSTPIFLFNYLDFKLWEIYEALDDPDRVMPYVSSEVLQQIDRQRRIFYQFRFTLNNSVEHVTPQQPDINLEGIREVDSFGNLCLITRSSNSRFSNLAFSGKKDYFRAAVQNDRVESLKQALIFTHEHWRDEEMLAHEKAMVNILMEGEVYGSLSELVDALKSEFPQELVSQKDTNMKELVIENKLLPRYLFRGERTVDWPTSMTTYGRSLSKDKFLEEINYILTGVNLVNPDVITNERSLYRFLREALFGISIVSRDRYDPDIDVQLAGIFQHYGFDTSLLDVTASIDIAASFAAGGQPGDIGQLMVLETEAIEDQYFELKNMPGNRAVRQNAYVLHGTTELDLKNDDFKRNYHPKWFRFKLTSQDKINFANPGMLSVVDDDVAAEIINWYDDVAVKDTLISDYTREYLKKRIDALR